ncbi:MAG: hypothetical protein HY318_09395 [Armatimonadetes bacterium]|nr:hypothetical protein [Armatimonadota bacterium]
MMRAKAKLRMVFLAHLVSALAYGRGGAQEMLRFGGMEAPYSDGIAQGWVKNCYGTNEATFSEETADVHGGKSAQRVACTRYITGGVQFRLGGVSVEKGKPSTLRVWMKGDGVSTPVYVGVRKHGEPYTGYLRRYFRVKDVWKPYIIMGDASDTDAECGIYLMFASTGTLLVDDVSLMPGANEEAMASVGLPPQKGNRVYNSGFEAGPEGWTPVGGFALDDTAAHSGKHCAKVGVGGIESRPFPVRTGQRYTLSVYIKAEKADTRVEMKFFEWADDGGDSAAARNQRVGTLTASTEWARYEVSGLALPFLWEDYIIRLVPSGPILLDDVQVEEGDATDYQPAQPIEVGAETQTRWCLPGSTVEVTAHLATAPSVKQATLRYTLEDFWSRPVTTITRVATPGTPVHATFKPTGLGMYRVRVQADDSPATGEVWFGVFPRRDRKPKPGSSFGTHVTAVVPQAARTMLASEAMGARWVRLHDFGDFCHWRVVEPEKGKLVWRDAEINDLKARGFTILANLGHPPLWAGRPDPKRADYDSWTNAPPRDLAEWENYVFKTVEHFKDRVRHWEVWNEPCWLGFFAGTPEAYAELLKVAYRAIKRADADAVVLGGCFSPYSEDWTQQVLAQGGIDFMDALSYHEYWNPRLTESLSPGDTPLITSHVQRYVELMKERGKVKPIYMTEGGIQCPPFASWLPKEGFSSTAIEAAAGFVKGMVEMLSAGVTNICYYYTGGFQGAMPWFSTMANGYYVLMDYDGRPKPTMMAYSAMEMLLGNAKPVKVLRTTDLTAHLFSKGKGSVAVVWGSRARSFPARGVKVVDIMGNAMKSESLRPREPIYMQTPGLPPAKLEALLRAD